MTKLDELRRERKIKTIIIDAIHKYRPRADLFDEYKVRGILFENEEEMEIRWHPFLVDFTIDELLELHNDCISQRWAFKTKLIGIENGK